MKSNRSTFITIFISFILIFLIPAYRIKQINEDTNKHEQYIGSTIILNGDTLTIVDWHNGSIGVKRGYTLSNGVIVDEKIINN